MAHCFNTLHLTPVASPSTMPTDAIELTEQFFKDRNYKPLLELAVNYRSFGDRPWNMWAMYRHLDQRFPDSRFILTRRDVDSWWRSTERCMRVNQPEMRAAYQLHLRVQDTSRDSMCDAYQRYNQEVQQYFRGTDKLLSMDIAGGDRWERLCEFLEVAVPDEAFPHLNRQSYTAEDAQLLREQELSRNGIECQQCQHLTPVTQAEGAGYGRVATRLVMKTSIGKALLRQRKRVRSGAIILNPAHRLKSGLSSSTRRLAELRQRHPGLNTDKLAVVSCLFNPSGSPRRVANFEAFLAGIRASGVHCLVVELAFGAAPFQLSKYPNVIQLRSNDIMWHKERLLNLGIRELLAQGYEQIAWLDGDILFEDPNWPWFVVACLETSRLCQVFSTVSIKTGPDNTSQISGSAVRYFYKHKNVFSQPPMTKWRLAKGISLGGQSGLGWAATADVLKRVELFEEAIVGGGDKLMFAASLVDDLADPKLGELTASQTACDKCGHRNQSARYTGRYLEWAQRWSEAVDRQVGSAQLHIHDMYHGGRADRNHMARKDILFRHHYDPASDLTTDSSGCLTWTPGKKSLHRAVESYFMSRREDV